MSTIIYKSHHYTSTKCKSMLYYLTQGRVLCKWDETLFSHQMDNSVICGNIDGTREHEIKKAMYININPACPHWCI